MPTAHFFSPVNFPIGNTIVYELHAYAGYDGLSMIAVTAEQNVIDAIRLNDNLEWLEIDEDPDHIDGGDPRANKAAQLEVIERARARVLAKNEAVEAAHLEEDRQISG